MMLNMANTGVARGKIYLAKQRGEAIPPGWAIDADGAPTTDPARAIEGIILPMGQHKGYAISVMMDVLSGALTGSGLGAEVADPYQAERRSRAGPFMLAIDIAVLQPLAEFNARIEAMIAGLKTVPLARGFNEVFYPGEIEALNDARNRRDGQTLPTDTLSDHREARRRGRIGAPRGELNALRRDRLLHRKRR